MDAIALHLIFAGELVRAVFQIEAIGRVRHGRQHAGNDDERQNSFREIKSLIHGANSLLIRYYEGFLRAVLDHRAAQR